MTRSIRSYNVVALSMPIVYNKQGDYDPNGLMYALEANVPTLKNLRAHFLHQTHEHPPGLPPLKPGSEKQPHPLVRPLVLRACKGEIVRICFENQLNQPASIHLQSDGYNVQQSDGADVGRNLNSIVAPGDGTLYEWEANHEGVFLFHDMANLSGGEDGTNLHGLFGVLIVEPEGATWTDPETGAPLIDGLYADVHPADGCSFREYAIFFHDEVEIHALKDPKHHDAAINSDAEAAPIHGEQKQCSDDTGTHTETADPHVMPISYRSEPMHHRKSDFGETQHHSSWKFGDPATPVLHAYRNDPAKIRLVHAGVKETHVFHLHVHQWWAVPENPQSPLLDSISISPQTGMTIEPLFGAGSLQGAIGDVIWHCHLYPHFHRGMWGMWRVHDVLETGQWQDGRPRLYPDDTPIQPLQPLPDRPIPPIPTEDRPGFPLFIPGNRGEKSPYPPGHPQRTDIKPKEQNYLLPDRYPGEGFVEIGPRKPADRRFNIVVHKANVVYNNDGWHDPDEHFFVLEEDEADVLSGKKPIEPLYIRANSGDVIELRFTNKLPTPIPAQINAFNTPHPTRECSLHQHLVKFDPLVSDGASVGWNYLSAVNPGETITYRWYADEQAIGELGTVFFHDHLMANFRQKHGLFGALLVEPTGAKHLNPETLEEIPSGRTSGSRAVIQRPDGSAFREFCLAVADFVPLFDDCGDAINPPPHPETEFDHGEDNGAMGVNYRCEPIRLRQGDPSRWFSSADHQDPETPVFETYADDPIHIRLIQGSHEEQHSFMVHGLRWHEWLNDPASPLRNQQTLGISEAFTFKIEEAYGPGDYLWQFASADDLWLGCWGLIRAHDPQSPILNLPALPGREGVPPLLNLPEDAPVRHFDVVARQREIFYQGFNLTDPFGLVYQLKDHPSDEPLVLRCRSGEWVEVTLTNELPEELVLEPNAPEVPVERCPDRRILSNRVSLHANLLRYDVRTNDGSYVGKNVDGTIGPGQSITYRWYADRELGVVYLQDMADFRNHRHHGLIGAIVVEPADATPLDPVTKLPRWYGTEAIIQRPRQAAAREMVLLLQDGLRLFSFGSPFLPLPDPDDGQLDPEDQGQKGFNYRCEPFHRLQGMRNPQPATPIWKVREGDRLWLRLVVAADKPRNHSFTVHGHVRESAPHLGDQSPVTGSLAALSTGSVRNLSFVAGKAGDYVYRTGVLRWALSQGLWGIIRIQPAHCLQRLLQWSQQVIRSSN